MAVRELTFFFSPEVFTKFPPHRILISFVQPGWGCILWPIHFSVAKTDPSILKASPCQDICYIIFWSNDRVIFHACWWQLSVYPFHQLRYVTVRLPCPCSPGIGSFYETKCCMAVCLALLLHPGLLSTRKSSSSKNRNLSKARGIWMQQDFPAVPPRVSALALSGGVFSNSFHTAPDKPSRLLSIPSTSGTQALNLANRLMAFCHQCKCLKYILTGINTQKFLLSLKKIFKIWM